MYNIRFYCPDCAGYRYAEQEILDDSITCLIHPEAVIRDFVVCEDCYCCLSTKSVVYTNTIELQDSGANYETINHSLGEQFIQATVMYKPEGSGETYYDQWINAEGVIAIVYHDTNNIRIYNDSANSISIGNCKIIIQK